MCVPLKGAFFCVCVSIKSPSLEGPAGKKGLSHSRLSPSAGGCPVRLCRPFEKGEHWTWHPQFWL